MSDTSSNTYHRIFFPADHIFVIFSGIQGMRPNIVIEIIMVGAILGLIIGFFGSIPVAGPVAVLVLHKGLSGKTKEGYAIAAGNALVEPIYCGMAVGGMEILFQKYIILEYVSRVSGSLFFLLTGLFFLFKKQTVKKSVEISDRLRLGFAKNFILGFSISIFNPVLLVVWAAVIASVYSMGGFHFSVLDKVGFPLMAGTGIFFWYATFLKLMKRYRHRFNEKVVFYLIRSLGIAIIIISFYMAWDFFLSLRP